MPYACLFVGFQKPSAVCNVDLLIILIPIFSRDHIRPLALVKDTLPNRYSAPAFISISILSVVVVLMAWDWEQEVQMGPN